MKLEQTAVGRGSLVKIGQEVKSPPPAGPEHICLFVLPQHCLQMSLIIGSNIHDPGRLVLHFYRFKQTEREPDTPSGMFHKVIGFTSLVI